MYQFLNLHPKGLIVNDCYKRAITLATGKDYMEVQRSLNRYKKITGAKKANEWKTHLEPYILNVLHGQRISYKAIAGQKRMNGERFCESHPKGIYLLNMAKHLTACVDGVIYDTWDCTEKCVYTAYKINPEF